MMSSRTLTNSESERETGKKRQAPGLVSSGWTEGTEEGTNLRGTVERAS